MRDRAPSIVLIWNPGFPLFAKSTFHILHCFDFRRSRRKLFLQPWPPLLALDSSLLLVAIITIIIIIVIIIVMDIIIIVSISIIINQCRDQNKTIKNYMRRSLFPCNHLHPSEHNFDPWLTLLLILMIILMIPMTLLLILISSFWLIILSPGRGSTSTNFGDGFANNFQPEPIQVSWLLI